MHEIEMRIQSQENSEVLSFVAQIRHAQNGKRRNDKQKKTRGTKLWE